MKPVVIYPRHEAVTLTLPDHLAEWDVWDSWEHERYVDIVERMTAQTRPMLWEVGAEHGAQAALYAERIGGDRIVLIEPSPEFWSNLRLTWQANGFADPAGVFVGLVADEATSAEPVDYDDRLVDGWPACSWTDVECPAMAYRYLFEDKHVRTTRTSTIDDLRDAGAPDPTGLSIDVEGAELLVLEGAHDTIVDTQPIVWVSIHPDLMARDFHHEPAQVHALMESHGYTGELLAVDHEEHWRYTP